MSVPTGSFGIGIFSYDKLEAVYDKPCAINVAPLERIGISVTMDKDSYNTSAATVYGYPGLWEDNFVQILTYTSEIDLQIGDADTIATNAIVLPSTNIVDGDDTITGQVIRMIPEDWADSMRTIHFIFQFTHNKAGIIETDYVVIPVRLTIRAFEDGTPSGLIELVSVLDNAANDVSKGVCFDALPETVTFTFQYNDLNPENFLFIPTIKSEFSNYQEHNVWNNSQMPQLTNDLVISADEDFTGGTAELVLDASKFLLGSYCVGAIAKEALPAAPSACVATIDIDMVATFTNWNEGAFTATVTYTATLPVGFTIERLQFGLYFEEYVGQPGPGPGLILQKVEDDVLSIQGQVSYPDNSIGTRPDGGQYRFRVWGLVRIIEDATGNVCSYNNYYQEFYINTPLSTDLLVSYMDSHSDAIIGLAVTDKGKQT